MRFSIYRYNPEQDKAPYMQDFELDLEANPCNMVLDALMVLKDKYDTTLNFRRSCREGVCGSDGLNINGRNMLACTTPIKKFKGAPIVVRPLPGLPVIRDLVVDMSLFYKQYEKAKPYLQNKGVTPAKEYLQSPEEHAKMDGLYDCIMCGCCSTFCFPFWWNPDKYLGPAALLWAYRFLMDSRDTERVERLADLADPYSVFRCHGIMNCVEVCPKELNPLKAINHIKEMILKEAV